jgi:hypothetical protein
MSRLSLFWLALMGTAVLIVLFFSYPAAAETATAETAAVAPQATPVTTITVNSGQDLDTSDGTTCATQPCTLRRAVIQARNLPAVEKPVLIAFDIPATAEEGYDSELQIWKIQFIGISSNANASLRYLNGGIIIDGNTQPGGRPDGPKIILVGPGTGQWDGIKLGENATQSNNEIHGLGFQLFKTHIYASSHGNVIEGNWFGLSDDGTDIVLRGGGANDGSGNTGISVGSNLTDNVIQHNVFAGIAGVAAALNGNTTTFAHNYIGTIADGTVPDKTTDPNLVCTQWDWLGGSGISVHGNNNVIANNIFAGLRINVSPPTIQADTIRMGGTDHTVNNNKIGLDVDDNEIGVCGRGIYLQSGTRFNQITNNQIIEPGLSAISLNDSPTVSTSDANTLRTNIIKRSTPWGQIDGNSEPEGAIQLGPGIHAEFRNFNPAHVTTIDGVTISGTAGNDSPCPNCIVELFLDDNDGIEEALDSLAVVTANAQGNWTVTLSEPLAVGYGVRTTSTTTQPNVIPNMSAGTTTGLSVLYTILPDDYQVYLPLLVRN